MKNWKYSKKKNEKMMEKEKENARKYESKGLMTRG